MNIKMVGSTEEIYIIHGLCYSDSDRMPFRMSHILIGQVGFELIPEEERQRTH